MESRNGRPRRKCALASASGSSAGPNTVQISAEANAGVGGDGSVGHRVKGDGGNASANASGSGFGYTTVSAIARGGSGNIWGTGNAVATGIGSSGYVTTTATSGSRILSEIGGTNAPVGSTSSAQSRAAVALSAPLHARRGCGISGHRVHHRPAARRGCQRGSRHQPRRPVCLRLSRRRARHGRLRRWAYSSGGAGPHTYYSTITAAIDVSGFSPIDQLLIGLLDSQTDLSGFSQLDFQIARENIVVESKTFHRGRGHDVLPQPCAAPWQSHQRLDRPADLSFNFTLQSFTAGSGFRTQYLFGIHDPANQWAGPGGGDYNTPGNWTAGTVPNDVDAVADFLTNITADSLVKVTSNSAVGVINFNSPHRYTIDGPSTIILYTAVGNARINLLGGNHTISCLSATTSTPTSPPASMSWI